MIIESSFAPTTKNLFVPPIERAHDGGSVEKLIFAA